MNTHTLNDADDARDECACASPCRYPHGCPVENLIAALATRDGISPEAARYKHLGTSA